MHQRQLKIICQYLMIMVMSQCFIQENCEKGRVDQRFSKNWTNSNILLLKLLFA